MTCGCVNTRVHSHTRTCARVLTHKEMCTPSRRRTIRTADGTARVAACSQYQCSTQAVRVQGLLRSRVWHNALSGYADARTAQRAFRLNSSVDCECAHKCVPPRATRASPHRAPHAACSTAVDQRACIRVPTLPCACTSCSTARAHTLSAERSPSSRSGYTHTQTRARSRVARPVSRARATTPATWRGMLTLRAHAR